MTHKRKNTQTKSSGGATKRVRLDVNSKKNSTRSGNVTKSIDKTNVKSKTNKAKVKAKKNKAWLEVNNNSSTDDGNLKTSTDKAYVKPPKNKAKVKAKKSKVHSGEKSMETPKDNINVKTQKGQIESQKQDKIGVVRKDTANKSYKFPSKGKPKVKGKAKMIAHVLKGSKKENVKGAGKVAQNKDKIQLPKQSGDFDSNWKSLIQVR